MLSLIAYSMIWLPVDWSMLRVWSLSVTVMLAEAAWESRELERKRPPAARPATVQRAKTETIIRGLGICPPP